MLAGAVQRMTLWDRGRMSSGRVGHRVAGLSSAVAQISYKLIILIIGVLSQHHRQPIRPLKLNEAP